MGTQATAPDGAAGIDARIAALADWRGETLARVRALIREADPEVVETIKWRKPSNPAGVPTFEHGGVLCVADAFKTYVKVTFGKGALLPDPKGVFNASLGGNAMRAIDIRQGEWIDEDGFKALIRAAVASNLAAREKKAPG